MNDLLMLAMMLGGPKYGYQVKREAGWMMGQQALHNNLVYPMLRKFLEERWVSKKAVPGERGQTRQQYVLTAEGRRVFFERMNAFSEADASSADAFRLRVGVFGALKAESREAILSARERYLQRRDQTLETLQSNMELGKFGGEIVRYMRKQLEMEQDWIRHLRRIAKRASRKESAVA
ncbi:MAG TPA: PadR family transcriptional regulator [Candidatus Dormibacteraeota bacterium]|nr:PadR family transcriptional regulator [Candidatus Dormibacteraeota bacterium]